ncbi:hypothetical protein [Luteolibacter sp. LG18]|uniref:hypothetical protein n=1 Tax=Luteolibacter sp. LG18 TaxID=2819286 RepID=UPI002B2A9604|nr:hypothetical protein llg_03190 [Luteolibacter sp. LG18]
MIKSEVPPATLIQSARAAVDQLGIEVVAGRYQFAIDRIYPRWKERMAKREGSMAEVDAGLLRAMKEFQRSGVSLLSSKAVGEAQVFEVEPGKRVEKIGGRDVVSPGYTKWLVLVPTVTRLKVFESGQTHLVDKISFQAAITDKGKNDWTFIDGSTAKFTDFRSLFGTLPADLKLPETTYTPVKDEPKR